MKKTKHRISTHTLTIFSLFLAFAQVFVLITGIPQTFLGTGNITSQFLTNNLFIVGGGIALLLLVSLVTLFVRKVKGGSK